MSEMFIICIVLLSIIILFKGADKEYKKYFLYSTISTLFWLIANYLLVIFNNRTELLLTLKLTYVFAIPMLYYFFKFALFFPNKIDYNKKFVFTVSLFSLLLILLGIFLPNFIVSDYIVNNGMIVPKNGPGIIPFLILILILLVGIFVNLYKQFKSSKGIAKQQTRLLLIGIILFLFFASSTDLVIPLIFKNSVTGNFGQFGVIFLLIFSSYAILAHHLFDIRVIIKRSIVYSVLLVFVLATYALIIFIFASLLGMGGTQITVKTIAPNLIAAIFIAAGFEPLRKWMTVHTDKFLFKGEYRPQDVLNKLSKVLSSVLDLDEALISIINVLVSEIRLERAVAFVLTHDPETKKMIVKRAKAVGYGEEKITLEPSGHLISYFEKNISNKSKIKTSAFAKATADKQKSKIIDNPKEILTGAKPLITEEIKREMDLSGFTDELSTHTTEELSKLKAEVALPIIVKGNLVGIFLLGAKKSGDIFSDNDLDLLTTVANQTAAAIEKARFYEEDQLKSEFVSIASHELLTPTSAIEGYLSMILDEGMGQIDEQAKKYLINVYASSKRLAGLVKDLLNVSRIEGGRIIIQSKNFDICQMIKEVITEMHPKAKERNLGLLVEGIDREMPQVWADPERVHQVLVNLIGNAIKYTGKGKVTVRADFSLSVVRVSVIDTGVGIPKDEVGHLFEKFYRASNADATGAQGTGLGLYITKQIVELMGGIIQVDSELGKGSAFSFSLPKAKEEKEKSKILMTNDK